MITAEFIESIIRNSDKIFNNYKTWLENLSTELISTELSKVIEDRYSSSLKQVVGNCGWESTEAALYGILALRRLQNVQQNQVDLVLKEVQNSYLKMLQFFQLQAFEDFLKVYLCEYHQLSPRMLGDRQKHVEYIKGAIGEVSQFPPEVFSENLKSIKTLVSLINLKTKV